jgi:hypothetical protein
MARLQSSRCAIVTGDGVSVQLTERRPSAASVRFDGAKLMTRLTDLLDPDQWLASGNKLSDFPLPRGASEREAVRLILLAKPELDARLERWSKLVMERGGGGIKKIGDVFTEDYLRELWERTRLAGSS